eukprot:CAMPEP_0195517772 /NCGR_PEP_ID=MMETSP0794_2-20130614/11647_1 /TAXON_ID=515487 /ORGANISM="Stephanopyxis turris, Strain CCMP 815" /LENGTH=151 /DNA_ID=CAMNT_0040646643 /DNA_START=114 /DNA_END=569 /DNA_ORIENTATION=+
MSSLSLLFLFCCLASVQGFRCASPFGVDVMIQAPLSYRNSAIVKPASVRLYASNKEEIAELEERLRLLKSEEATSPNDVVEDSGEDIGVQGDIAGLEGLLTEKWKEEEDVDSGINVTTILGTIGVLVFLVFFSQIPVGNEGLSRYSDKIGL